MSGQIFCWMTGDCVTPTGTDSNGNMTYTEEHGYVDLSWSREVLHESRNDVRLLVDESADSEDLADYVRDVLGDGSLWADNGDGSFYSQGEHIDDSGRSWTYAVHFSRKYFTSSHGWIEQPWHPVNDGGINLRER